MLGFSEFKLNFKRVQEGFTRTKENERLKSEIEQETEKLKGRYKNKD